MSGLIKSAVVHSKNHCADSFMFSVRSNNLSVDVIVRCHCLLTVHYDCSTPAIKCFCSSQVRISKFKKKLRLRILPKIVLPCVRIAICIVDNNVLSFFQQFMCHALTSIFRPQRILIDNCIVVLFTQNFADVRLS